MIEQQPLLATPQAVRRAKIQTVGFFRRTPNQYALIGAAFGILWIIRANLIHEMDNQESTVSQALKGGVEVMSVIMAALLFYKIGRDIENLQYHDNETNYQL